MTRNKVLIIDDQKSILESMKIFFGLRGWEVHTAPTGGRGLSLAQKVKPSLVVLDVRLPDLNGIEVFKLLKKSCPNAQVIMVTAYQDMENTIKSIKLGAFDFIHKPIDINEMDAVLKRLERVWSAKSVAHGTTPLFHQSLADGTPQIMGASKVMKEVFKKIALVSESKVTVLIQGESGTGKELIARAIHHQSPLRDRPFMVMDCSTLVDTLMESELFGYEKGAFTGADTTRKGRLELAENGTIFFDEIGEMTQQMQSKLLRFIQDREFTRVGGNRTIHSDARILAATNRDLVDLVRQKQFRDDLYFRLKVVTIQVPSLRERRGDIPALSSFLLDKISSQTGLAKKRLGPDALKKIVHYNWPGNVRQLENALTRAVVMTKSEVLTVEDILPALQDLDQALGGKDALPSLALVEKEHIYQVLSANDWHYGKACLMLGISRPTLRAKIKKYGLSLNS